jgi:hypothetical protein
MFNRKNKYNSFSAQCGLARIQTASVDNQQIKLHFKEIETLILKYPLYASQLASIIIELSQAHLFSFENLNRILPKAQYAFNIELGFKKLKEAGLATQENFQQLVENAEYACQLGWGFFHLKCYHPPYFEALRDFLIKNARYADKFALGFLKMAYADVPYAYRLLLKVHPDRAIILARGLIKLHEADLLKRVNIKILLTYPNDAFEFAYGFEELNKVAILEDKYRLLMTEDPQFAFATAFAISQLKKLDLLTEENLELFQKNKRVLYDVGTVLEILYDFGVDIDIQSRSKKLVTSEVVRMLVETAVISVNDIYKLHLVIMNVYMEDSVSLDREDLCNKYLEALKTWKQEDLEAMRNQKQECEVPYAEVNKLEVSDYLEVLKIDEVDLFAHELDAAVSKYLETMKNKILELEPEEKKSIMQSTSVLFSEPRDLLESKQHYQPKLHRSYSF